MPKVLSPEEFLEAWKKESDACARVIFGSVPVRGPVLSGDLKRQAVETIMRVVWYRIDAPDKEEVLWQNRDPSKSTLPIWSTRWSQKAGSA